MTKTEMLEILRGKVLQESPEEIQARLNEIADELEQSERVVHGHWIMIIHDEDLDGGFPLYHCSLCDCWRPHKRDNYCPNCGARMDEVIE